MYAATENHSILTISKWERRHARPFLTMPRTADPQNPEPDAAARACRASANHDNVKFDRVLILCHI